MSNLQFDVAGAKAAGYTDTQIADTLSAKAGFDAAGARKAGFGDADIIGRLTTTRVATAPAAPVATTPEVEDPGVGGTLLVGAGRTFDRIGKGMQQLYYGATGNAKAQADLKMRAAEDDAQYKKLQDLRPFATGVGEALPSMVLPGTGAVTTLGAITKLGLSGAVPAALEYGTAEERAKNAAGAGAGAVIGGAVVPKVAGLVVNASKSTLKSLVGAVTPEAKALGAKAEALGIPINAAQLGDSKFIKTLSSAIEQMPFTGGAKAGSDQRAAFTRAVSRTFGADADKITPAVYAAEKARLGSQFDDLAMRNTLKVDDQLMSHMDGVMSEVRQFANDDTIRAVDSAYKKLLSQTNAGVNEVPVIGKAGVPHYSAEFELPGAAYSSLDSALSKAIKGGGEKATYLKTVQNAVRDAMDRSISPADQAAWTQTRTQYKNLKAVRDIVSKDGGGGNIPPTQLLNALNNSEAGKEAMAMGTRGQLGEIGRIGKQFVHDSVPNSGTAQRAVAMGLIGGGGYAFGADPYQIAGMMAGGATAGRAINKILMSPKVIESLGKQGLSVADLMKMPPSVISQIVGGASGMSAVENARN